ncbi:MAG: PQQ-dependent catabolism-associated CXXCW motif protein, partial [Pseudomonadota bacterium]
LVFCLAGCWMSWNAAKRALEYGYTDVYWYPDGTDGWDFSGYELEEAERAD